MQCVPTSFNSSYYGVGADNASYAGSEFGDISDHEDNNSQNSISSFSRSHSSRSHQALECDYCSVTPLFKAIEKEQWQDVHGFLTTGRWRQSTIYSSLLHLQSPSPDIQARTWVTATNSKGEIKWSHLPLHAAITYMAPLAIIRRLVDLYPEGVRSADESGNLPLHLAFGFGAPDSVVSFLLSKFPEACQLKSTKNRAPVDCSELGSNKVRGKIIKVCQDQARDAERFRREREWRKTLSRSMKSIGYNPEGQEKKTIKQMSLDDILKDYALMKKELETVIKAQKIKREQERNSTSSTSRAKLIKSKTSWLPSRKDVTSSNVNSSSNVNALQKHSSTDINSSNNSDQSSSKKSASSKRAILKALKCAIPS